MRYWILVGHTPIETDQDEWGRWFEGANRFVSKTTVAVRGHDYEISTIFLGIEYGDDMVLPQLFETMVFTEDEAWDNYQRRSRSYLEAKTIHRMIEIQVGSNDKP